MCHAHLDGDYDNCFIDDSDSDFEMKTFEGNPMSEEILFLIETYNAVRYFFINLTTFLFHKYFYPLSIY
jgi:hypothetical protein